MTINVASNFTQQ